MPDPQTTNLGFYVPLNGADVGTWDVPMNANWTLADSVLGATATVALNNVPVTLSPAQYNANLITFNGTLTGNVVVTFPPVGRSYLIFNACVANTTFYVRATTGLGLYVALPPNEVTMVACDGTDIRFVGLGRIGTYWDFGGSTVPLWVTNSNPQPYLNCDGTAFSSATYPALRDYLGVATLPDARGRFRAALNQGTARQTGNPALGGLDGNTLLSSGGSQNIVQANLPAVTLTANNFYVLNANSQGAVAGADFNAAVWPGFSAPQITSLGSGSAFAPPSYVGGLTLIRAG